MHSENPSSKKHVHLHLNLPEEISEEILSRLPVKSVLRFRCVSKSWLSLVESNRFIKIHYQNSLKNTSLSHHRVIFNGYIYSGFRRCYSLQSLLNSNSKKGLSSSSCINININSISIADKCGVTIIVGCCNGLLCLLSTIPNPGYVFWLWNPATKVVVELPQLILGKIFVKFGFGWDESSGAFKVFATTTTADDYDSNSESVSDVYSSKTNSWKTLPPSRLESNGFLFNYFGYFVCGRIHWAILPLDDEQYVTIMSFNLENDEFERIELPPNANATEEGGDDDLAPYTWLGEIGGCLCTLFEYRKKKRIDVWVMKEYGVKDSWLKRLTFSFADLHLSRLNGIPPLFGECGLNGEIFITCYDKLMVYSPEDDDFSKVSDFSDLDPYFRAFLYVESLVSPLRITTIRGHGVN